MIRAALYARHSTDMQQGSVADQLFACRKLAAQIGAEVVREFSDEAISGQAMGNRPGVTALLHGARAGLFDVVIAEHTDRLSRGPTDSWSIFEDLKALGVRYLTVNQGEITFLHQGVATIVSAAFLDELGKKTRRGGEGAIRAGRFMGSTPYGYEIPRVYDAQGERVRGVRAINEAEAEVVRRIFHDTANGASPQAIAQALNAEGVPGPRGGMWSASTIYGNPKDGLGILRNELYRGRFVWGRLKFAKDRTSGGRRRSHNPAEVQRREAPELRIVSDEAWEAAQAQLTAKAIGPMGEGRGQRRPKALLSGLIRCGLCGGQMTRAGSGDALRCVTHTRDKIACPNGRNPRYGLLEGRVLVSIQANLLHPDVVADAVEEYRRAMAEGQKAATRARAGISRELAEARRRQARLVAQMEEGMPWSAVAARHGELDRRIVDLQARLNAEPGEVVTLHPAAAGMYRKLVSDLHSALGDERGSAAGREAIRALVDEVRFLPREGKGQYELAIHADLSPVLASAEPMRDQKSGSSFQRSHKSDRVVPRVGQALKVRIRA